MKKQNNIQIEKELKVSYLNYAMSVIIGRALPDVRDGLKPVHRRILFAMYILKNYYNKPYKKSARIVGDVIGKYHPHGDTAVYETIVRMVQNFSSRYPLIDGQGNFGSIDGDSAAAMRYTEIRMSKISENFLEDIEKNTVNLLNNYDETKKIPEILPTKIPNILINGSTGIAVGMATNIPPHNIKEIINACLFYLDNKHINTKSLMKYIKGPDFPTGGIIENYSEIYKAYKTGKGTIKIKSKIKLEKNINNKKKYIVICEIPYQINKTKIIEKIIELIKNKTLEGINNIRDESNKNGIRIVIEIKKKFKRQLIINKLLYLTNLSVSYGINIIALYKGKPKILNLKKILKIFIKHRKNIIKKRTIFKLKNNINKIHIYEGIIITLINIDKILYIIKKSKNINEIQNKILNNKWNIKNNKIFTEKKKYKFSKMQLNSILKLSLIKLNKIEKKKIYIKYNLIKKKILKLNNILENKKILVNIIKKELIKIKEKFGDKRLTKINKMEKKIKIKDLIKKEKIIIIINKYNYIGYQKISKYKLQNKGGKGKNINKIKNNKILKIIITYNYNKILLFTNLGKCYELYSYDIPYIGNKKIGKPIINFLNLKNKEKITSIIKKKKKKKYLIIITQNGIIEKIKNKNINIKNKKGLNIIKLKNKDKIIDVSYINKNEEIMIFTKFGKAIRFKENNIRTMNRNSSGVKAIKLNIKDKVKSLITINKNNKKIIIITKNGYGKKTLIKEFNTKNRAIKGITCIKINKKNSYLIKSIKISKNKEIIIITNIGNIIRIKLNKINLLKRNTQGIILIKLNNNEKVIDSQLIN